ncbi:MAG: GNAT family N-acetyltransferase [Actinomycetota bacterium]|nr:GNAT family N-acetyltransferase [Actinomycetota bacterium]
MQLEIRPVTSDEFETFLRANETAFGVHAQPDDIESGRLVFEPARSVAAFDGGRIVGTAGAFSLMLTVPGGQLPMPGVTAVGVQPTHRRQGVLTSLMRRQLDDYHDQGELIAGLWASEGAIYGRFGYGAATNATQLRIQRWHTAFAVPYDRRGRTSIIDKDSALKLFPSIYERISAAYPGMVSRPGEWWRYLTRENPTWSGGFSPLFFAIYESPEGEAQGYVSYRVKHEWPNDPAEATLKVNELMAETPDAYAGLWRLCFDHDLIDKVEAWPRQADEPLLYLLANPRELNLRSTDGLWLRLVDVPAALSARRYATEGEVVFEVKDPFCPWNEGRYLLQGGPSGAECRKTDRSAGVALDQRDLAAAYLGGVRFRTLARAGRVVESTDGALATADRMFVCDPPPWCAHIF